MDPRILKTFVLFLAGVTSVVEFSEGWMIANGHDDAKRLRFQTASKSCCYGMPPDGGPLYSFAATRREEEGFLSEQQEHEKVIVSSNFWGSTVVKKETNSLSYSSRRRGRGQQLPCVPSLDLNGMLPLDAYTTHSGCSNPVCRISLAIDLKGPQSTDYDQRDALSFDPVGLVRTMQNFVEDGMTSFQLPLSSSCSCEVGEEEVFGRFLRETPDSLLQHAHLSIPFQLPPNAMETPVNSRWIRSAIKGSLHRMGSPESIHCVQLHYRNDSPYHMEALDTLQELKREGLIESVAGRNLPPCLFRDAAACGFSNSLIVSNQVDVNVMDPSAYITWEQTKRVAQDLSFPPLQASAPLLSGFLSDKFVGQNLVPLSSQLPNKHAQRCLRTTFPKWAAAYEEQSETKTPNDGNTVRTRRNPKVVNAWAKFQSDFMPIMENMSRKHAVPVASVAIRWLLQLDHVESTVVSTTLYRGDGYDDDNGNNRRSRKQHYRNVFRFALDDEDMAELWSLSGGGLLLPPDPELSIVQDEPENMEQRSGGLFLPRM